MVIRMTPLFNLLSAFALGMSLTLAFAPFDIFPFAIIAPALLLGLWLHVNRWQAFRRGYAFGLGFFGTGVYWIYVSIRYFGEIDLALSLLITLAFIATLALFPAMVGYLLNRYFPNNTTTKILCAFPALWVFSEWVRSWVFTGFPWLFLGYSQIHTPLKGYAPLFSVYGVSLSLLFSSGLCVTSYQYWKRKQYWQCYVQLITIVSIWVVGGLLSLIPWTKEVGAPIPVSLIQGNIPQSLKWSPNHLQLSLDTYQELTDRVWDKSKIIIWPESAIPATLQDTRDYVNELNEKANKHHAQLLMGIPITSPSNNYYNAIVSLGKEQQVYTKQLLVPFGEFLPKNRFFHGLFSFLNVPLPNMEAGVSQRSPFIFNDLKILPSICYEITFPEFMNVYDKSIGAILTVTNDAWFGKTIAQAQHLQMAAMRAIELKRPLLFISNDGITAIINADGNIVQSIPPYETGVLNGVITARFGLTPWMQNKMAPLHLFLIYLIFLAIREKYKKPELNDNLLDHIQLQKNN